jgi:hypothetical protein
MDDVFQLNPTSASDASALRQAYEEERARHAAEANARDEAKRGQADVSLAEIEAEIEAATAELRQAHAEQQALLTAWQDECDLRQGAIRRGEDAPPLPPPPDLGDNAARNGQLQDRLQAALEARDSFPNWRPPAGPTRALAEGELADQQF